MTRADFIVPVSNSLFSQANHSWSAWTIVIPSVSIGNTSQLAVDLLISTLLAQKQVALAAHINTYTLRPVVGPNPYDLFDRTPATPADVYTSVEHKLVIVQIRSAPYYDRKYSFIRQILDWIKECSFMQTILLTSSFSHYLSHLDEEYLAGFPVKFLTTSNFELSAENLQSAGMNEVIKVEKYSMRPDPNGFVILPGCGFVKNLFEKLEKESMKAILMVKYCSEGDNTKDAVGLLVALSKCLKLQNVELPSKHVTPISWNQLFGDEDTHGLF